MTLNQILDLVGPLDDSAGADTPRERFRRFLTNNVLNVVELRDHLEQCLRIPGDQNNRALQDWSITSEAFWVSKLSSAVIGAFRVRLVLTGIGSLPPDFM